MYGVIRKSCQLFDTLFRPILLYSSEVWGAYDNLDLGKWEKDTVERLQKQFYKHYLGLNRRAPNVASQYKMERLSLKLNIYFGCISRNLPENSIARQQCLKLSILADTKKKTILHELCH